MVNSTISCRAQFVKATIPSCLTISEARLVARLSSGGLGHADCKHNSVKNACLYEYNGGQPLCGQPSMVLICKHRRMNLKSIEERIHNQRRMKLKSIEERIYHRIIFTKLPCLATRLFDTVQFWPYNTCRRTRRNFHFLAEVG